MTEITMERRGALGAFIRNLREDGIASMDLRGPVFGEGKEPSRMTEITPGQMGTLSIDAFDCSTCSIKEYTVMFTFRCGDVQKTGGSTRTTPENAAEEALRMIDAVNRMYGALFSPEISTVLDIHGGTGKRPLKTRCEARQDNHGDTDYRIRITAASESLDMFLVTIFDMKVRKDERRDRIEISARRLMSRRDSEDKTLAFDLPTMRTDSEKSIEKYISRILSMVPEKRIGIPRVEFGRP